jgi:hypothetical protein
LVTLGIIAGTAVRQGTMYSGYNEDTENVAIPNTTSDTLYVDLKKINVPANFKTYWNNVYSDGKYIFKKNYPDVNVVKKDVKEPYLTIKKSAEGYSQQMQMKIPVEIQGNTILFPNFINYPYDQRFRNYRVTYELVVPKSKTVISKSEYGINLDTDDDNNSDDDEKDSLNIRVGNNSLQMPTKSGDSAIVNGKKISNDEAYKILKKMEKDADNVKNVDIRIKNGKKEVTIKNN